MKRPISERSFDLREWQQEAFRNVINSQIFGKQDFLCVATPGAGKTKFALCVAHYFLQAKIEENEYWIKMNDKYGVLYEEPKSSLLKRINELKAMAETLTPTRDKQQIHF